ncbi:MAG: nicotinamide-nucleotide amidohydrolase family protein [Bacteroidales bacterium]|nr:nicotinamide-nucleotide amidohydrolase family protein [Bacteroidales bacterium]
MNAGIIIIGDEILIGQVVDINSSWISREMNKIGFRTETVITVGDDGKSISDAIDRCLEVADVVFMTGGLGPTKDDITKKVICEKFGTELVLNEAVLANVAEMLGRRGIALTENNRGQALVPATATVVNNAVGTAPGIMMEISNISHSVPFVSTSSTGGINSLPETLPERSRRASRRVELVGRNKLLFSMPGVPFEMRYLMEHEIIPLIKKHYNLKPVFHKTLLLTGIAESILAEKISDWEDSLAENVKLAYLPAYSSIRLRLSVYQPDDTTESYINAKVEELKRIVPENIIAYEDIKLEELVGKLLKDKHFTVATAESCTGGKVASLITSVSGSSEYYKGSVVSYCNEVKADVLGVSRADLEKYGAVSSTVAEQMASGVRRLLKTDYAVATTGIAGPTGGSDEKPVGTVWIAVATPTKVVSRKYVFGKDRAINIERFAASALSMLIVEMEKEC